MPHICQECLEQLSTKGFVFELYSFICDYYTKLEQPLFLYEPAFRAALHYLEINRFVITTEAFDDVLFVMPLLDVCDDPENGCWGYCQKAVDCKQD